MDKALPPGVVHAAERADVDRGAVLSIIMPMICSTLLLRLTVSMPVSPAGSARASRLLLLFGRPAADVVQRPDDGLICPSALASIQWSSVSTISVPRGAPSSG